MIFDEGVTPVETRTSGLVYGKNKRVPWNIEKKYRVYRSKSKKDTNCRQKRRVDSLRYSSS